MSDWIQWRDAGKQMGMAPRKLRRLLDENNFPVIDTGQISWQVRSSVLKEFEETLGQRRKARPSIVASRLRDRASLPACLQRRPGRHA